MYRCDRRCDGCDRKFGNLVGTKHTHSRKAIEFSTIFSWQMSVWLSWRTTRDSVANQFQTDSLSRCPSHAHSKCVLDLPALWKNGVSFLWTCRQKIIRVWQDGASFWLFLCTGLLNHKLVNCMHCIGWMWPGRLVRTLYCYSNLCLCHTDTAHRSNSLQPVAVVQWNCWAISCSGGL